MRKLLILGTAMALLGGVALAHADTAPAPAAPAATPAPEAGPGPGGPGGPQGGPGWNRGPGGPGGPGWHHWGWGSMPWQKGRPPGPRMAMGGAMPPPASKGAHVILEHGRFGGRIDVKCADNDSTQDCIDAVKSLMAQLPMMRRPGSMMRSPDASEAPAPETPAPKRRRRLPLSKPSQGARGVSPAPLFQIAARGQHLLCDKGDCDAECRHEMRLRRRLPDGGDTLAEPLRNGGAFSHRRWSRRWLLTLLRVLKAAAIANLA